MHEILVYENCYEEKMLRKHTILREVVNKPDMVRITTRFWPWGHDTKVGSTATATSNNGSNGPGP